MMEYAIASLYLDNFIEIGSITDQNKQKYCEKHGYDFLCKRDGLEWLGFDKIEFLIEELPKYKAIWWNDADSLVTNSNLRIEDSIPHYADFVISWDELFLNAGSFIIRNSPESMDFLRLVYSYKESWKTNPASEQGVITSLFLHEKFRETDYFSKIHLVGQRYLNSFPEERLIKYPNMLKDGIWKENDWLVHLSGLTNEERLQIINKYIEKSI